MRHEKNKDQREYIGAPQGGVVKPKAPDSGFGFARKKDVNDTANQQKAPPGPAKSLDRTGDEEYEEGLESFEQKGGSGVEDREVRSTTPDRSGTNQRTDSTPQRPETQKRQEPHKRSAA